MASQEVQDTVAEAVARFKRRERIRFGICLFLLGCGTAASGIFAVAFCGV